MDAHTVRLLASVKPSDIYSSRAALGLNNSKDAGLSGILGALSQAYMHYYLLTTS